MKAKLFLTIVATCLTFAHSKVLAQTNTPVDLQASIIDPTLDPPGHPKSPVTVPTLSLDDHDLYFDTPCDGCTLNIVDSNNVVVYTIVIPTGTTSLVLPATLFGEYELQIICGNYRFYGKIDLP